MQRINLAFGLISQMPSSPILFLQQVNANGVRESANEDLGFIKSPHLVLAYDQSIGNSWRIKA